MEPHAMFRACEVAPGSAGTASSPLATATRNRLAILSVYVFLKELQRVLASQRARAGAHRVVGCQPAF